MSKVLYLVRPQPRSLRARQRGHMDLSPVVMMISIGACMLGVALIAAGIWLLWAGVRGLMGVA